MGSDKSTLDVGGRTLLDHTLSGIPSDTPVVIAGPAVAVERDGVSFALEDPPGGGPVAGLDAALALVRTPVVVVLATDLPLVGEVPAALVSALGMQPAADGVLASDASGRLQQLCAAYRVDALRAAIEAERSDGSVHGSAMRSVVARLTVEGLTVEGLGASEASAASGIDPTWDVDTPEDLARVTAWVTEASDNSGATTNGEQ